MRTQCSVHNAHAYNSQIVCMCVYCNVKPEVEADAESEKPPKIKAELSVSSE